MHQCSTYQRIRNKNGNVGFFWYREARPPCDCSHIRIVEKIKEISKKLTLERFAKMCRHSNFRWAWTFHPNTSNLRAYRLRGSISIWKDKNWYQQTLQRKCKFISFPTQFSFKICCFRWFKMILVLLQYYPCSVL